MRSDSPYSEVSPAIPVEDFSGTGFSLCGFDFRRVSKKIHQAFLHFGSG